MACLCCLCFLLFRILHALNCGWGRGIGGGRHRRRGGGAAELRRGEFREFGLVCWGRRSGGGRRGGTGRCLFRGRVEPQEGFANRLGQQLAHGPFAMEFHLALGRVDVDVHLRRIDFEKQAANRVAVLSSTPCGSPPTSEIDAAILHRPAVDKNMLLRPAGARNARRAQQSPDAQVRGGARMAGAGFSGAGPAPQRSRPPDRAGGQIGRKINGQQFFLAAAQGAPPFAQGPEPVGHSARRAIARPCGHP